MSIESQYFASRRKKKEEEELKLIQDAIRNSVAKNSIEEEYFANREQSVEDESDDIAPVRQLSQSGGIVRDVKQREEDQNGWFKSGAFSDGYDFGDVTKTILGTLRDVEENALAGILEMGEKVIDTGAQALQFLAEDNPSLGKMMGKTNFAPIDREKTEDFVNKDLYNGEKIAENILGYTPSGILSKITGFDAEKNSLLGEKADGLTQSGGQLLATMGLQAVGVPWYLTSGVTSYGGELENALREGADFEDAGYSALTTAAAEVITEKMFGGIKFGGKAVGALDDVADTVFKNIKKPVGRSIAKFSYAFAGEGSEEVASDLISKLGQWLTYQDDKTASEMFASEEALEGYLDSFIGGAVLGGISGGVEIGKNHIAGKDAVTGLTKNEDAVVRKIYENELEKAKDNGEKVNKGELWDSIVKQMDNGEIDIDTIEEVLGGEEYTAYKNLLDEENAHLEELSGLFKGDELKTETEDYLSNSQRNELKKSLDKNVRSTVSQDRLINSFVEYDNQRTGFQADVNQYDNEYARKTIQNIIDSKSANNGRKMHELADFLTKISADKEITFSVTDAEKLANTFVGIDPKNINGYVTEDGITINLEAKNYLNRVVGHEVTHVLEGTEFYDTFRGIVEEYAKSKGEYDARLKSAWSRYKKIDGYKGADGFQNIKKEVVADLAGDYLFSDMDFVKKLSVENRNIFQKIYDEIKYLCKVATAGSKEARDLERVKKAFEDAYRADTVKKTDGKTTYSLSDSDGNELSKGQQDYFKDSKMRDENGNLKIMYHGSQDAGFHTFDAKMSDDDTSFFFVDSNDVAASYSGTTETYEAQTIHTAEDMNRFIESIGAEGYEVVEKDGKFTLLYEGDRVADSNTAKGIYDEFCWYEGVGEGDANYKVYLNLTNPLEIDAKGKNWNNISREFSQELADKYNSLTAEEKGALLDLAEWGDFQTFRDEILSVLEQQSIAPIGEDQKHLASAIDKLGGNNINISNLFSIASDNFSAESIQEFAVKQMNTRDYAKKAKAEGYDGVIFKNIHDNGGYSNGSEGASTVAIAFDSNQIKSVANQNPTADPDIRFSISEDTDGRKLSEEQQNYFKDVIPELKDKNGNLKVLYHGTPNNFTQFNYDFIGSNGTALGKGFYLTERKDIAEGYLGENGNVMELYANITKPMSLNDMTISEKEYRKFVVAVDKATEGQYLTNFGEVEYEGYNTVLNRALEGYEYDDNDVDLIHSVFNAGGLSWEEGFRLLKDTLGYDGVVENNYAGTGSSVFVPTLPEQIKNVDNKNPTDNPDINLSLSENGVSPVKGNAKEITGDDVRLRKPEAVAPVVGVAENATTTATGDKLSPIEQTLTDEVIRDVESGLSSEELLQKADEALKEFAQLHAIKNRTKEQKRMHHALREQIRMYEQVARNPSYVNELKGIFPDDVAPISMEEQTALNQERLASLDDADMPPMAEAPYYGEPETPSKLNNPFEQRDYSKIGSIKEKSFMENNPDVKPFFKEAAREMLGDLHNSTKGERWFNGDLYYESGGEQGFGGVQRYTTQDIADLLDGQYHYTYAEIEDALNRIINDEPLNACAKRIEFALNDRLMNGYTDVLGYDIPANQEYIDLMQFKQEMDEAYRQHQESVEYIDDADVPTMEELYAPIMETAPKTKTPVEDNVAPDPVSPTEPQERGRVAQIRAADKQDKGSFWQRTKKMFNDFVSLFGDKGIAVENLSRKIGDTDRKLQASYDFMRNRSEGMAQARIETELMPIMKKAEATGNRALFDEYADTLHHIDRMSLDSDEDVALRTELRKDLEGYTMQQIERIASETITRNTPQERVALIFKAQQYIDLGGDKGKNKSVLGDVTKEEAIKRVKEIEAQHPEFKAIEDEVVAYNRGLLQDAVNAGLLTQKQADLWVKIYPHYVPVFRHGKNGNSVSVPLHANRTGVNSPFKRATGGNSDILPLFEAMARNTGNITYDINRNKFGNELFEALQVAKMIDANESVTDEQRKTINQGGLKEGQRVIAHDRDNVGTIEGFNPKTGKYSVYFENASKHYATVDIDAKLITPIGVWDDSAIEGNEDANPESILENAEENPQDTNGTVVTPAQNGQPPQFTIFVKGKRVTFDITPEIYDSMIQNETVKKLTDTPIVEGINKVGKARRAMLTKYDPFFALARNPVRDTFDVFVNSQHAFRTYLTGATKTHTEFITKGKYYQEFYKNGGLQNSVYDRNKLSFKKDGKVAKAGKTVMKPYNTAADVIEQYWRLSEYIASREQGKSIEVALLDSARVTTNFGAGGDITKAIDRAGGMFINPSVQGVMQTVRNFREAHVKGDIKASVKNYAILGAKLTSLGIVPILANLIFWDDDEDYEELSDYVKQNYHIVGKTSDGKFIRIPKGRMQAVMQNAFEQIIDAAKGEDEIDFDEFGDIVANNIGVNNPLENNLFSPLTQAFGSGDAGKTWYGEDLVPSSLQGKPAPEQYDASTDEISKFIGKVTNTSPYKWNYVLDQYGAGVADVVLPMLTTEAEGENFLAPIRDEFVSDPVIKNQNTSDFYTLKDELSTNANSDKATDNDILMSKYMNSMSADIGELYQKKREIQNGNLPDSEKYAKIREIQEQINELAETAIKSYESIETSNFVSHGMDIGTYAKVGDKYFTVNKEGEWTSMDDDATAKYLATKDAGDSYYATDGTNHYRWYEPGEDAKSDTPYWKKLSEDDLERQKEITSGLGISASQYWSNTDEYGYAYEYPENYTVAKAVGGYDSYRKYSSELYDIKADKDSNGKSISGSRKNKVIDYISGLDIDYGEKIILFKNEYNADDTYNYEIIDYLNSRDDISYSEMETILKKLGFTVDSNGNISW